jgi:hypothetical protein
MIEQVTTDTELIQHGEQFAAKRDLLFDVLAAQH